MAQADRDDTERSPWSDLASDIAGALAFYTRIKVPDEWMPPPTRPMAACSRGIPVAGLVVGAIAGFALWLAGQLDTGFFLAASIGLLALTALTGALHEDGLADFADANGAANRERRLEIMRDSHIGSYGVLALMFSVLLRLGALVVVAQAAGLLAAACALAAAACVSRTASLWPLKALPPARRDGASAGFGRPKSADMRDASLIAAIVALVLAGSISLIGAVLALAAAAAAARRVARLAERRLGGQTGDVAGAAAQSAEIAFLVVLAMVTNLTIEVH